MRAAVASLIVLLAVALAANASPIHAGADTAAWSPNSDNRHPPATAAVVVGGEPALRLTYTHELPGWGHVARAITTPPDAYALRLRVCRLRTKPGAAMHIWLFEPDGDGWVAAVEGTAGTVRDWPEGWNDIDVFLQAARYEPRGDGKRALASANRLLMGFNGADCEVAISRIEWLTQPSPAATTAPGRQPAPSIRPGVRPTVAIFADDRYAACKDGKCAPSDPARLAGLLESRGYGVAMLKAEHLADPGTLDAGRFPLLLLPCGPAYPVAAEDAIRRYLSSGGGFFSTGGYVFDRPMVTESNGSLAARA